MDIIIRYAKPEEAEQIVDINIEVWKTTYKGIVPDDIIEKLQTKTEGRIAKVAKRIEENHDTIVAVVDGKIVGYHTFGKTRDDNYGDAAEIYTAYILDDYQGLGLGRKMAVECMKKLVEQGYKTMITKCLDENPSNDYHKSLGGVLVGQDVFEPLGIYVGKENIYFHNDLEESLKLNLDKLNKK